MQRLDLTLPTAAEYLAADEVLLDLCETGHGGETLIFWEPGEIFVVVGYANKVAAEVNVEACEARGVPIYRRCSGGGTVVQMPGGLNYSLILPITEHGPTRNITSANRYIMEKNAAAVQTVLAAGSQTVFIRGHTDLTLGNPESTSATYLKFAGNAQRRRKHFLLFHGTLLLNCELPLISELLQMPSLQPDYRDNRAHERFLTNLNLPAAKVKEALANAWDANTAFPNVSLEAIRRFAQERYSTAAWNFKF